MSNTESSNDPVRARRQTISRINDAANRLGYLLWAIAMVCFVTAFVIGFKGILVNIVTACIIAGSILLAPSIIIGYAVKAAERDDLEHGR
jgi:membrane-bound ClpP family serine protease